MTSSQAGKLCTFTVARGRLILKFFDFNRPTSLAWNQSQFALGTPDRLLCYERHSPGEEQPEIESNWISSEFLTLKPVSSTFLGNLEIRGLEYGADGLWLVNTFFGCLCTPTETGTFAARWKPHFVSELVSEDRCHLNGLAIRAGFPAFATALGESNQAGGWRSGRRHGGILMDVPKNEVVIRGLSMPHSPRWYQNGLWMLESGDGSLLRVDLATYKQEIVSRLPAFLRGLAFSGTFALIGMSSIRETNIFGGLPVHDRHRQLLCGIAIVNWSTGKTVGTVEFDSGIFEVSDVAFLPHFVAA